MAEQADEARLREQLNAINELVQACQTRGSLVGDCVDVLGDLLDGIILDVAVESHRLAHLGLIGEDDDSDDEALDSPMPSAAVLEDWGAKNQKDIFGQSHPQVASDLIPCANCKRPIMAGRFAPHLEKCLGKAVNCHSSQSQRKCVEEGRNSSRMAKRPTSYLEPTMANIGVRSSPPKKSKMKAYQLGSKGKASTVNAALHDDYEGLDNDYENMRGAGGTTKKRDLNANSTSGKLRRKIRSLLAERVRFTDLKEYIRSSPGVASGTTPAAAAILHAAETFRKLAGDLNATKKGPKANDVNTILGNICCVVSQRESTRDKICANSVNCPIHSVTQREEMRRMLQEVTQGAAGGSDLSKKKVVVSRPFAAANPAPSYGALGADNDDDAMVLPDIVPF